MQFTKINKSRHAAYVLHVHLVFITKYRKPILGDLHHASLGQYAAEVCRDFGAELKECDGEADHVHMLMGAMARLDSITAAIMPPMVTNPSEIW